MSEPRHATPQDIPAITALVNRAYEVEQFFVDGERTTEADVRARMTSGRGAFLVIDAEAGASAQEAPSRLQGAIYVEIRGDRGFFAMLAVDPAQQRSGLGRRLVSAAEEFCRTAGCQFLDIDVVSLRTELPPFYAALGFAAYDTAPFHDRDRLKGEAHVVLMTKPLGKLFAAPYGTWRSPVSAASVAAQGLRLGYVSIDGDDVYWLEGRPQEGGRNVLVRCDASGRISDLTRAGHNVRTRVHEYGGGAYLVADGVAYYSNFSDQRIYRMPCAPARGADGETVLENDPAPLTPEGGWFFADYAINPQRTRLVCVREDHTGGDHEPSNTLVSLDLTARAEVQDAGQVIASGFDFYSTPRFSPDGLRLSWLCWRHPNMPWDGTELWVADVAPSAALSNSRRVAGADRESIFQPGWSPDGRLYYVSDRSGWWNVYRSERWNGADTADTQITDLTDAEFGMPQWQFGSASWAFAGPSRMVVNYSRRGRRHLALVDPSTAALTDLDTKYEPAEWLVATPAHAFFVGGSPASPTAVVRAAVAGHSGVEVLRSSASAPLHSQYVSKPEALEFPTDHNLTAHAFYYPPRNADVTAPGGERPPLIVISHGGPTTATKDILDLQIQFWTTRGFAVADVNYRGSSGYGREYRERLNGQWGIVDVADCVNAARFLAREGKADAKRLAIRGGSAGGYTTLAALTFHPDVFNAGASYYGISDIEVLARDTHKFESRYLDTLVGPYPAMRDVYRARSPIHFVDRLNCPLILFQGVEDPIVPPNQAEMMAKAVRAKGLPVAVIFFEGEQHGFRKADTIIRSLEAELYFYGKVFGFLPADPIEPIPIDNLATGSTKKNEP